MSKVFCKECNLVYLESEYAKLHAVNNLKGHNKILEKDSMEAIDFLSKKLWKKATKLNMFYCLKYRKIDF